MRQGLTREGRPREEGSSATRRAGPLRVLFICSRNRRRSPTAEAVFAGNCVDALRIHRVQKTVTQYRLVDRRHERPGVLVERDHDVD